MRTLAVSRETWPLVAPFRISRGTKQESHVVTVMLSEDEHRGRGEGVPYPRYGESLDVVVGQIESIREAIEGGLNRFELLRLLPPGSARNAVDCALWDLEAKQSGRRACRQTDMLPLRGRHGTRARHFDFLTF